MSDEEIMSDASSSSAEPAPAAVLSRSRRATAGTRMTSLVGKAAEADEAFWSHQTWNEEGGYGSAVSGSDVDEEMSSGASSFRESDEDEEDRVDAFDSDFDLSESEEDEDEAERKAAEREAEMRAGERRDKAKAGKSKAGAYADIAASAGRELLKKKIGAKKRGKKGLRAGMGDGMNAGLVLNFPGAPPPAVAGGAAGVAAPLSIGIPGAAAATVPAKVPALAAAAAAKAASAPPCPPDSPAAAAKRAHASSRHAAPTRTSPSHSHPTGGRAKRNLRAVTVAKSIETTKAVRIANRETAKRQRQIASRQKANPAKRRFTQEELLIEAANVTEPENERWMLARKRVMNENEALQEKLHHKHHMKKEGSGGETKVISKFHSRRGCYNTITFPEMDLVPEILSGRKPRRGGRGAGGSDIVDGDADDERESKKAADCRVCVITGKKARYRDPKTMLGYHDAAAFKELRRRLDAGEPIDQRNGATTAKKKKKRKASALESGVNVANKEGGTTPVKGGPAGTVHAATMAGTSPSSTASSPPVSLNVRTAVESSPGGTVTGATAVPRPKKAPPVVASAVVVVTSASASAPAPPSVVPSSNAAVAPAKPTSATTTGTKSSSSVAVNTNITVPLSTSSSAAVPPQQQAPKQDLPSSSSPSKEELASRQRAQVVPSPGTLVATALMTYRKMSEEECS